MALGVVFYSHKGQLSVAILHENGLIKEIFVEYELDMKIVSSGTTK